MTCDELTARVLDRSQPASERLRAAQQLLAECRDYRVWGTLCSIVGEETDDAAVRCGVAELLPNWNRYACINFLVRAFNNEAVRRTAIATLEKLGPAEGEWERRLLADMEGLRTNPDAVMIAGLPWKHGRDPRVLVYLNEMSRSAEPAIRAIAVRCLCQLGEVAQHAADDSSPTVRAALCETHGFYRESRAADILERLLADGDAEVARQAKKALRLLGKLEMPRMRPAPAAREDSPWRRLLSELSQLRLRDKAIAADVPDDMVEAGWLGEPGASEIQIVAAEKRLNTKLPTSYREFLKEANGFRHLSPFIWELYGTEHIDWFRVQNKDWIEAYQVGPEVSAEEHLRSAENEVLFRAAYLWSCLQISDEGDSAVVLLNPEVTTDDGEWEAWFFANWLPGARRYRSFEAFMVNELAEAKRWV